MTPVVDRFPNPDSRIPTLAKHYLDAVVSVLLAPSCAVCSAVLDEPRAGVVCGNCWAGIRPITPPVCDVCGDPLARQTESRISNPESRHVLCRHCERRAHVIARARAVGEYDGVLREVVHALKYGRRWSVARPLAGLMRVRGADLLHDADGVVPVPLHWRRQQARGFNQAAVLAQHLGVPVVDALRRTRQTVPQVELAADRRHQNVRGAFALRRNWFKRRPDLRGLKIVVVDDVSTTGATLEACAMVLREAGALEISALTAARVASGRH